VRDLPRAPATRCDLHVHSRASRGNDEWFTRLFGCPESYVEPARQYELARARGMDFFTLTDHDTIDGCVEIAGRVGVFFSEEVTAVFPDEGCTIHVLAWDIDPDQHAAIQARRRNVYHLVDYLCHQGIAHAAAHPLLAPSWNLTPDVLEKLLLMFPVLERVNGLLDARIARDFEYLIERIDGKLLRSWARKHGLSIRGSLDGRRAFCAGSDDHALRKTGLNFTEIPTRARTPAEFLREVAGGRARAVGGDAALEDMATTIQRTSYEFLRRNGGDVRGHLFVDLLDAIVGRPASESEVRHPVAQMFGDAVKRHVAGMARSNALDSMVSLTRTPSAAEETAALERAQWVSDGLLGDAIRNLAGAIPDFDVYRLLDAVRDLTGAAVAAGPLFGAAAHFGRQESQVRRLWARWSAFVPPSFRPVTAVFSDSMGHKDGVSSWCDQLVRESLRAGEGMVVPVVEGSGVAGVRCDADNGADVPYRVVPSAASYALPFYSTFKLQLPSPMATLRLLARERVTRVELATPGPMGLVGALVARALSLPVTATYHTDIVAMGIALGANPILLGALRRYVRWFYGAVDRVRVFSEPTRRAVLELGVSAARIDLEAPCIDPDDFSPRHRDPAIFERLGIPRAGRPVVLSVGRVSREKNLPIIIDAVRRLQDRLVPAPLLVIVGDGPERPRLERASSNQGFAFFVGHQERPTLQRLYASAQVFAFASQIDTLGLVNLEALASGLPIVIPEGSNVASLLRHDEEAYCYPPTPAGLESALVALLQDPHRAARLSSAGRLFVADRTRDRWGRA
jgi:glycosyltransferase involved in cell wall biosynthesis